MKDKGYAKFEGGDGGGANEVHYGKYGNGVYSVHPRGQHLCKFIGTKESVGIRKEFNPSRTGFGHQHGCRFIVFGQ